MKSYKQTAIILSIMLVLQSLCTPASVLAQEIAEPIDTENVVSEPTDDATVPETEEGSSSEEGEEPAEPAIPDEDGAEMPDSDGAESAEEQGLEASDEAEKAVPDDEITDDIIEGTSEVPEGETLLGEPPLPEDASESGNIASAYAAGAGLYAEGEPFEIKTAARTPEAIEIYLKEHLASISDAVTYQKKPVTSNPYDAGKLSDKTLSSAITMLNRIRYIAGLESVELKDEYNAMCQAGALVNYVNNKLTHYPSQPPGMDDALYELGKTGCGSSNIAWSSSSDYTLNSMTVKLWMGDSDSSNIDRLGHRRWLLNPSMSATGFGAVSGANGTYGAVYAFDRTGATNVQGVSWPARIMPTGYFAGNDAWSFSVGEFGSKPVDKSTVSVTLTRRKDKKTWKFSSSSANGYFNVDNGGYGQRGCIIFRPSGVSSYSDGDIYDVDIAFGGQKVHYTTAFFTPGKHNKITYVLNGGENDASNPEWFYSISDTIELKPATKKNFSFDGWYTDSAFKNKITQITSGTNKDLTLYAHWVRITHGSCGDTAEWWLDEDEGSLKIKGNGTTESYDDESAIPWDASIIYSAEIEDGITSIGARMFMNHHNLGSILIPESVTNIAENAFEGCENLVIYCKSAYVAEYAAAHGITCYLLTDPRVANPVFGIQDGTEVGKGRKLYISSETTDAEIYYTTDGSEPGKAAGTLYDDAIVVERSMTVRAVAVKEGFVDSEIVSVSVLMKDEATDWGDIAEADRAGFATAADVPSDLWLRGISDTVYTGKAITFPELRVYNGKTLLKLASDYTVKYTGNVNAGTANLTVTGKGNYAGKVTETFRILQADIGMASAPDFYLPYTGKRQNGTPVIRMELAGKEVVLKNKRDYELKYEDSSDGAYTNVGSYTVKVEGKGNFRGWTLCSEIIVSQTLISRAAVAKIPQQDYKGGQPVTVDELLQLTYNKKTLAGTTENAYAELPADEKLKYDYTYSYQNNINAGKAEILITGVNDFAGERKVSFVISGYPAAKLLVEGIATSYPYTGTEIKPAGEEESVLTPEGFGVYEKAGTEKGKLLIKGRDYLVKYVKNTAKGTGTVLISGIGGYTGTLKKSFKIVPYNLGNDEAKRIQIAVEDTVKYTKGGTKAAVTVTDAATGKSLREGVDYTLSYKNNKIPAAKGDAKEPTVTVKGKGNYAGAAAAAYTISNSSLAYAAILAGDVIYQEKSNICKPKITLTDTNGKKLAAGTDYEKTIVYTYAHDTHIKQLKKINGKKKTCNAFRAMGEKVTAEDIIPADTILKATVTGKGYYQGSEKSAVFRYKKASIAKASITVTPQKYTGRAIEPSKNDIKVKLGRTVLSKDDYEIVGFTNNIKKGKAGITIRGRGNYGGVKEGKFVIGAWILVLLPH